MIILDTNVISELLKPSPHQGVAAWVFEAEDTIATTAITAAELLTGVEIMTASHRKNRLKEQIASILAEYQAADLILPFDGDAALKYASIISRRRFIGHPISTEDAQIAAITSVHGAYLATRNIKDFAGLGLQLIDPWGN